MNLIDALQKAEFFEIKITKIDYSVPPYTTKIESVQNTTRGKYGICRLLKGYIEITQVNDMADIVLRQDGKSFTGEVRFTQKEGYKHICVLILGSGCVIEFIKCQPELDLELTPHPVEKTEVKKQYPYTGYTSAAYSHKD